MGSPGARVVRCSMHDLPLLTTIAAAFAVAWALGLLTQRIGLSPIVGYLLAGVVIGPYTAGFVGDVHLAQQLAEVGVILMMFGVGLHFHLKDLLAVKHVAVPGAVGQSLAATLLTMAVFHFFGWPMKSAMVLGMAMAVASTVVLLRVLMDRQMLSTVHGHVAVGWLIVEDIITVLALVLVPVLGDSVAGHSSGHAPAGGQPGWMSIGLAVLKLAAMVAIVLVGGSKVVPWILAQVAKLRSAELFTLTVLVLSIAVAVGSASLFGASVALGAFLAGMVVAQSPVSHQAASNVLPMRDAFAVLFFVSVGMLFDPGFLTREPWMVAAGLAIVLLCKPIAALVIVAVIGYPARTALTVAIGLAQIGEFSFILSQIAREHGLMPEAGTNVLVATAMISITLNPLLFGRLDRIEKLAQRVPWFWRLLNRKAELRAARLNTHAAAGVKDAANTVDPTAVVVGYGPVGRLVDAVLRDASVRTVVVDLNLDTVETLTRSHRLAVYGDATRPEILEHAGIASATNLIVTLPDPGDRVSLVRAARQLNASVEITVRATYLTEREPLLQAGASHIVFEEGEAGVAMARHVMERRGVAAAEASKLLHAVRKLWKMQE